MRRKGAGSKVFAWVLSFVMTLSLVPAVPQRAVAADDLSFEEGHIKVTGKVTVASDKQLVQDLRWSFPFENPLRPGEGIADPGRPYKYVIWQSKKATSSDTWSAWESRSAYNDSNKIRVLNVAPNAASKAYLTNWMNMATTDPATGEATTVGRGLMDITAITLDEYNANPNGHLMETVQDAQGNSIQQYRYDVIMFGTYDANDSKDLVAASRDATVEFARHGGGLMFGHDTVTGSASSTADPYADMTSKALHHPYFNRFAKEDFLDIFPGQGGTTYVLNHCKVVDTGFLTSRPWDLNGQTLTIPTTHVLGQSVKPGSNARVWMQMSDASGNVQGIRFTQGNGTDNYYLVTNGSNAMIQTGHSNGQATVDEAKVFANTLLYIAQGSRYTSGSDLSFADEDAPSEATASLRRVTLTRDGKNYSATLNLRGSVDAGTQFAYKIQGIPQAALQNAPEYVELWSDPETFDDAPDETASLVQTALSGLRGYWVRSVDTDPTPVAVTRSQVVTSQIVPASNATDTVTYTSAQNLSLDTQYYAHVYAVDWAGNVSGDTVVPIQVLERRAHFHRNEDGASDPESEDDEAQSLFTNNHIIASYPDDPVRDGYRFDGWYLDSAATGTRVVADGTYPPSGSDPKEPLHAYAKWVKTWGVMVSQKGNGTTGIQVDGADPVPVDDQAHTYDTGTRLSVSLKAPAGGSIGSVWLDDELLAPSAYEGGTLDLGALGDDHHVVVEYLSAEVETPAYAQVTTRLTGDAGSSTITKSTNVPTGGDEAVGYRVDWAVDPDREVEAVYVDGVERPDLVARGATSVTFSQVDRDHDVEVRLRPKGSPASTGEHRVSTRLTGGPGTISPSVTVADGEGVEVTASIAEEFASSYDIRRENVVVTDADGNPVTPEEVTVNDDGSVTVRLPEGSKDCTVEVRLTPKDQAGNVTLPEGEQVRIDTGVTGRGTISPSAIVRRGGDYPVTWEPADGWVLQGVTIDRARSFYPERSLADRLTTKETDVPQSQGLLRSLLRMASPARLMAAADDGGDPAGGGEEGPREDPVIDDAGSYPFYGVDRDHTVHATFVRADAVTTDPEEHDGTTCRVLTSIVSEGPGSITASASALAKGSSYPVSWDVPEGYAVTGVFVNGESRPDLAGAGEVVLEDLQADATVKVVVERVRTGSGLKVKEHADGVAAFVYNGTQPGSKVLSTLASLNDDEATAWARSIAERTGRPFLGWSTSPEASVLVTSNDTLPEGYTTVYPVFGAAAEKGEPSSTPEDGPDDPGDPDDPDRPVDPDAEPVDPADPGSTPAHDPTVDPDGTGDTFITKVLRNLTHPRGVNRVGDTVRYYITAQNNRLANWEGVTVSDPLPQGVVPQAGTMRLIVRDLSDLGAGTALAVPDSAYDAATRRVTYTLGDVAPGTARTLVFDATLTADALAGVPLGTPVANSASVLGTTDGTRTPEDPDHPDGPELPAVPAGPAGGVTADVELPDDGAVHWASPDISVTKSAENLTDPSAPVTRVGDRVSYAVEMVTDKADSAIENGIISDTLPEGVEVDTATIRLSVKGGEPVAVAPEAYDAATRTVKVACGTLMAGERARLTFEATVSPAAHGLSIPNVATGTNVLVGPDDTVVPGAPWTDPVPEGGTDSAPAYPAPGDSEHAVIYADPELALEKTAENLSREDDWYLGDTVGYTVVLSNRKDPSMGHGAVLVDVMSDGLALDTSSLELTLPDGTVRRLSMGDVEFDAASNTLRVPVGDLAGGENATLTYRATIREPSAPGKIVNSVSATATGEGGSAIPDGSDGAADVLIRLSSARLPGTGASASASVLYPVNGRFGLLGRMADEPALHAALTVAAAVVAVMLARVWRRRHA
ncbi:InlB B-repeat-containing protein [Caniella muris]|uniref:InlB B-repeat-containing protein n=1 Tax=Caniella muris TaxID=2941502 RepID=UPI002040D414|nr:InlB B-repeat-containing protein [Caniella muris]